MLLEFRFMLLLRLLAMDEKYLLNLLAMLKVLRNSSAIIISFYCVLFIIKLWKNAIFSTYLYRYQSLPCFFSY